MQPDARAQPTKDVSSQKEGIRDVATHLVLDTARLHLVGKDLGAGLLRLRLVDVLHEYTLVLEDVTLGLLVQLVVPLSQRT